MGYTSIDSCDKDCDLVFIYQPPVTFHCNAEAGWKREHPHHSAHYCVKEFEHPSGVCECRCGFKWTTSQNWREEKKMEMPKKNQKVVDTMYRLSKDLFAFVKETEEYALTGESYTWSTTIRLLDQVNDSGTTPSVVLRKEEALALAALIGEVFGDD